MHLLSKQVLIKYHHVTICYIYMCMHLIMSYHHLCIHDTYVVHMHAIGVPEGVTLLEFEQERPEE
jgi:hypothetical protein